jgi:hypothetical protein
MAPREEDAKEPTGMPTLRRTIALVIVMALVEAPVARAASPEELEQKLKALEQQVNALRQQLEESKAPPPPAPAPVATAPVPAPAAPLTPAPAAGRPSWLSDFKIGGYGSTRFETSDLRDSHNTFTFRRFVLTGDATIGERLRSVVEIEFERLNELEVERRQPIEGGVRGFSNSIEGSDGSAISLEQAWMQFSLTDAAKFRAGMLLVPLGRFNINHDDNRWDLPRRSLIDRGVSVLPAQAAWSEVGMGFVGDIPAGDAGKLSYEAYVMNGVTLDATIETVARASGELEAEVEIRPRRGTANLDFKNDKAGALRLAWSPTLGTEFAVSGYGGRYTPSFLPSETLWAVGVDGKVVLGAGFEVEGEYLRARYEGIRQVARGLALRLVEQKLETGTAPLGATVEFELAGLAETKQGYWLDLRYRFFPDFLRNSILARRLDNPQFIATTRIEQVWLDGLVKEIGFSGGALNTFDAENRFVNRLTVGLAYRPVPLVVLQAAYEHTWTNRGKSLSAVTNFIPARATEDTANTFLLGAAFGF